MMKQMIQDLKITPGKSCLYASLYDLMTYYGFGLSESETFFICDSMLFEYTSMGDNQKFNGGEKLTSDNYQKWAQDLSDILYEKVNVAKEIKDPQVFDSLMAALEGKNPILLFIDSQVLDYHPRHYQLNNIQDSHCVILYGVDTHADQALIGDSYIVDDAGGTIIFSGPFPLRRIIEGTQGVIWLDIDHRKAIDKRKIHSRVAENLEKFLLEKKLGTVYKGNFALYKCIDDLRLLQAINSSGFEAACTEVAYFMSAHFLSKFDYLINILVEDGSFHVNNYEAIVAAIKGLKSNWSLFCVHLLKTGYSGNKSNLDRIVEKGINLVRTQESVFLELLDHIKAVIGAAHGQGAVFSATNN